MEVHQEVHQEVYQEVHQEVPQPSGSSFSRFDLEHGEDMAGATVRQLFQQAKLVTRIRRSINGPPKIGASCDCCVHGLNGILEKPSPDMSRQQENRKIIMSISEYL